MAMLHKELELSALNYLNTLTDKDFAAYASTFPDKVIAAMHLKLKKGALHKDLGVPEGKKLTSEELNKGLHSKNPLTRKRARFAKTMRKWKHHSNEEVAYGHPLAKVFVGEMQIGDVTTFRGRFIFNPSWDAGPNIPVRFFANNPEEMKMMLAQRGLRVESASINIEIAASQFWNSLNPAEKKAYLKAHPHSKYGATKPAPPATKSPTSSNTSIKQHLEKEGFQSKDGVWSHPVSKNKIVRTPSKTHKHHFTVTHKNGEVTRHKTNSDEALKKMITNLAKKPDTSGISKALSENKGSLHEYFGKQPGEKLTLSELEKLANSDHPLARRARLVFNIKRAKKRGPITWEAQR